MKANWLPLSAAVALALGSVTASAVDFHGYMRSGINANAHGGDVVCGNIQQVGRLGNECNTFVELILSQELYNKANTKFDITTQVTYDAKVTGGDWQATEASGQNNLGVAVRQMWGQYVSADGYSIWAGKRFYQRKDVYIIDDYYLNNSGYGTGIENIDTGVGFLNFAVISTSDWDSYNTYKGLNDKGELDTKSDIRRVYKLDARWNSIPVGFGKLDVALIYGIPSTSSYQDNHGYVEPKKDKEGKIIEGEYNYKKYQRNSGAALTVEHSFTEGGLSNNFVVQYGTNGLSGGNLNGYNYSTDIDARTVRLIDHGTYDFGSFGMGYVLGYKNSSFGDSNDSNNKWEYNVVVRPEYKWTEYTRTSLELGVAQEKNKPGSAEDELTNYKFTLAQQFTPGKSFWSRPAIRFYVTYLGGDSLEADRVYNDRNYQISFGSQVEAWW